MNVAEEYQDEVKRVGKNSGTQMLSNKELDRLARVRSGK